MCDKQTKNVDTFTGCREQRTVELAHGDHEFIWDTSLVAVIKTCTFIPVFKSLSSAYTQRIENYKFRTKKIRFIVRITTLISKYLIIIHIYVYSHFV